MTFKNWSWNIFSAVYWKGYEEDEQETVRSIPDRVASRLVWWFSARLE